MLGRGRARKAAALLGAVAVGLPLSACGTDQSPTATRSSDAPTVTVTETSPAPTPTLSESIEPTASPTKRPTASATKAPTESAPATASPTAPTTTRVPAPGAVHTPLRADLLPAGQLPGLNAQWRWRERSTTRGDGKELPSSCMPVGFRPIGATAVYRRDYTGPGEATATHVVARFADAQSAARTWRIWLAWYLRCEQRVRDSGDWAPELVEISQRYAVPTARGQAMWWLLSYGPVEDNADARWFEPTGVLRVGRRVSLVVERTAGQDYAYPRGEEPVALALHAAAARLG